MNYPRQHFPRATPAMSRCTGGRALAAVALVLALAAGCSRGPSRVEAPDWDPEGQAEAIMTQLDKNGDARLDGEELKGSPGLAAGVRLIDDDKDGNVTAAELQNQFAKYRDQQLGLVRMSFHISYKGRGVPDAQVTFIPEPFLEGIVERSSGTTDIEGVVIPTVEGQDVLGMQLGYYRVQVNSPNVKIPAKYSSPESPLGVDVSPPEDAASYGATMIRLKLED